MVLAAIQNAVGRGAIDTTEAMVAEVLKKNAGVDGDMPLCG
jgi:hypothetical protein